MEQWANALVEGPRYDMLTTNNAECKNSLLKDIREFPISKQVEAIHSKLRISMRIPALSVFKFTTRLTP